MRTSFKLIKKLKVDSKTLYDAWLDSEQHTKMTGGQAKCSSQIDDEFIAWDGYIFGNNVSLIPNKKIVQNWRTTEFKDEDEDSEIIIELNDTEDGCELTLTHTNIPEEQPDYNQGWVEHYFEPMDSFFSGN